MIRIRRGALNDHEGYTAVVALLVERLSRDVRHATVTCSHPEPTPQSSAPVPPLQTDQRLAVATDIARMEGVETVPAQARRSIRAIFPQPCLPITASPTCSIESACASVQRNVIFRGHSFLAFSVLVASRSYSHDHCLRLLRDERCKPKSGAF